MHNQHTEIVAGPEKPASNVAAPGFGSLARRIATWTSNLLASAIVLVCALALGRHVLHWNRPPVAPQPDAATSQPLDWLQGTTALAFHLGEDAAALQRRTLEASADEVGQRLLDLVRQAALAAADTEGVPLEAHSVLRHVLGVQPPVECTAGVRIHRLAGGPPLVIAVADAGDATSVPEGLSRSGEAPAGDSHAGEAPAGQARASFGAGPPGSVPPGIGNGSWRVLAWGMAIPRDGPIAADVSGEAASADGGVPSTKGSATDGRMQRPAWDVYTWRAGGPAAAAGDGLHIEKPNLPPGCHWTLMLASGADGEHRAMLGLRGATSSADCREFFNATLSQDGYRCEQPWRTWGGVWHARFRREGTGAPQSLQIQLADDPRGGMLGLVHVQGREATAPPARD